MDKNKYRDALQKLAKTDVPVKEFEEQESVDVQKNDGEFSTDTFLRDQIFPEPRHGADATNAETSVICDRCDATDSRTFPTNPNYTMIDPDDDSCDTSKS